MREDIKINDRALALEKSLIEKLELVFDTDVELDVYNLGLIYEIHLDEAGTCKVVMTLSLIHIYLPQQLSGQLLGWIIRKF